MTNPYITTRPEPITVTDEYYLFSGPDGRIISISKASCNYKIQFAYEKAIARLNELRF